MKNMYKMMSAGAAIALAMGSQSAIAQQNSTATADTSATIVEPIAIAKTTDLKFGRLASVLGTVSIAASDGARTSTNNANLITANGSAGAPVRAAFAVSGEPNLTYSIAGGTGEITLTSGSDTLTATLTGVYVLSKTGGAGIATTGTLDSNGADTLGVGASLPILAATPSGVYTNTAGISITVAYN